MANPQEIVGDDWQEIVVGRMTGGLNLADQAELIDPQFFTRYENVIPYQGKVQTDTGYIPYLGTVRGNPRKLFQHITRAGVGHNLLITNATVYRLAADEWQLVSNGNEKTVATADVVAGATTMTLNNVTGLANNEYLGITRDDGTQMQVQITNIAGSVVTFTPAFTGDDASVGNAVIEAILLNGTDDEHVVALTVPWSDECVFTNGVDSPQFYDPSAVTVEAIPNLPSSGDTQCKSLALFDNSLFLINTTEAGQDFPQRYRWSDRADITNWSTGESGSNDLLAEPH